MNWQAVASIVLVALLATFSPAWGQTTCREWGKVETTGPAIPPARRYPVMTISGELVQVFGGNVGSTQKLNDFWMLNLATQPHTWIREKDIGIPNWSSSGGVYIGGHFYLYGGVTSGNTFTGDTWRYTFHTQNWTKIEYQNETNPPEFRNEHTCAPIGSELYLFGGWDGNIFYDNLWVFETLNARWTEYHPAMPPTGRNGHSTVVYAGNLYVFGGIKTQPDSIVFRDLWRFSVRQGIWQQLMPRSGSRPSPRYGHAAVVYADHMYIFGGHASQTGPYLNELWSYDFERTTWELVEAKGTVPSPRSGAGAVVHKHWLQIYGGSDGTNELSDWYHFDLAHCPAGPEPGPPPLTPIEVGTTGAVIATLVFLFILIAIMVAGFWMLWRAFKPAAAH